MSKALGFGWVVRVFKVNIVTGNLNISSNFGSLRNLRLSFGSCRSLALTYAHIACICGEVDQVCAENM